MILGENAINFYRLNHAALSSVAERIGPKPSQLLGENHNVDFRKIEHFQLRAGYQDPAEVIDTKVIDQVLNEDIAECTGTGE